jgi:hypothetical protein
MSPVAAEPASPESAPTAEPVVLEELVGLPGLPLAELTTEEVGEEEPPQAAQAIATTAEARVRICWRLILRHAPETI